MTRLRLFACCLGWIASLLLTVPPAEGATSRTGVIVVDACSTYSAASAGKAFCFDKTDNILKEWDGARWRRTLNELDVRDDGAKFNGVYVTDAAITTGTANLNSATASCVTADVGKTALVYGAGAASADLYTTIASCSGNTFVLTANAGTTVSSARFVYATDDTTAIQATLNRLAQGTDRKNLNVKLPSGIAFISTGLSTANSVSNFDLYGASMFGTQVYWNGAVDAPMILLQRARNVRVRDFALFGNSTAIPKYGVEVRGMQGTPSPTGWVGTPAPLGVKIERMWIGSLFGESIQRAAEWTPGGLKTATDGAMTSGSGVLTATASFDSGDVGKYCTVPGALSGIRVTGYITAFTDATHVTLSQAASSTVTGKNIQCSWDANNEQGIIRDSFLTGTVYGAAFSHLNSRLHRIENTSATGGTAGVSNAGPLGTEGGSFTTVNSLVGNSSTGRAFEIGPAEDVIAVINGISESGSDGGLLTTNYTQDNTRVSITFTGGSYLHGGAGTTCTAGSGTSDYTILWNAKAGTLTFNNVKLGSPSGVTHCYPSTVTNLYDGVLINGGEENLSAIKANMRVGMANLSMQSAFAFTALTTAGKLITRDNYGQASSGDSPVSVTAGTTIDISIGAPTYELAYAAPTNVDTLSGGSPGQKVELCGNPAGVTNVTLVHTAGVADKLNLPEGANVVLGIAECRRFTRSSAGFGGAWYQIQSKTFLTGTFALNLGAPGAVPGCVDSAAQTLTGAALGDVAKASIDATWQASQILTAFVNTPGQVTFRVCQFAGAGTDPDGAGANYKAVVEKQ